MGFLQALICIFSSYYLFKPFFPIKPIDLSNPTVFQKVGSVTIEISKDIYYHSAPNIGDDNDFTIFDEKSQYVETGKIIKTIGSDDDNYIPKMLVWDWNGDKALGIQKVRILTIRGTQTKNEWVGNLDCKEMTGKELGIDVKGVFHKNFGSVSAQIWDKYKKLILQSSCPVIITGHSRGAAIAEILYVIAKNEINKKNIKLPIYCMAYAPPPSMSLNEENSNELTSEIHAFVHGNDIVPRIFVSEFINYYNNYKSTINFASKIFKGLQSIQLYFLENEVKKISSKIASYFPQISENIIVEAFNDKKDELFKILEDFNFDPNNVKIKEHVGTLYLFDKESYSKKHIQDAKLESPKELSQLNTLNIWEMKSFVDDHSPSYYQLAFIQPTYIA